MKKTLTLLVILMCAGVVMAQKKPKAKINVPKSIWCEGDSIHFGNQSTNADSFYWYLGDGATSAGKKAVHAFTLPKDSVHAQYTVSLVAVDMATGAKDSSTQLIKLEKSATAKFTFRPIAIVCFFYPECENYLGLDWNFGDGTHGMSDADSITHIYPGTGTYKTILVANTTYQCNDTFEQEINIVDSAGGSISENNFYRMTIYPNPSKTQVLEFELPQPESLGLTVSDATGRVVYTLNKTYGAGRQQIQLGQLLTDEPSGLYFVTLNNSRASYVLKAFKSE
ncbi:T9SS type A sorting domain-containing protein [bacterium]|nr:T9SS type A sorting domain-containing protein [bacterium]